MAEIPNRESMPEKEAHQLRIIKWLLRLKSTSGIRSPHFKIISVLMVAFAYTYYGILSTPRDVYVILFFYPLIYAAITYRLRGVILSGLVFLGILLPHAILVPYDLYSLARSLLFAVFAFLISALSATLLNYLEQQLEAYEEILSLNAALDGYIEQLQSTQKQLIQAEKMNALGQLSAALAHELNNPLAGVLVYTKLLAEKMKDESLDKAEAITTLAKIDEVVSHCSTLVHSLLDFARQTKPVLQPMAMNKVIDQVMSLVGHQAQMKNIKVTRR